MEISDLVRQQARARRHAENKGRLAGVYAQFTTTGGGVVEIEDAIDFGLTYIEKPWLSYGHEIDPHDVRDALDLDEDDPIPALPSVTCYVTDWEQDENDCYTGAWIAIAVYLPPGIEAAVEVPIMHYVSFHATAIKTMPLPGA